MKKASSILLTIIFMLSFSICAFSAGATSGTCSENATWNYDTYTCTLTISGSDNLNDYTIYTNDEVPWYGYRESIRTVIIKNGITSIGDYMFKQYYSLSNITIPGSVKSIGSNAFYGCKAFSASYFETTDE